MTTQASSMMPTSIRGCGASLIDPTTSVEIVGHERGIDPVRVEQKLIRSVD
jgi:hypothetical protein